MAISQCNRLFWLLTRDRVFGCAPRPCVAVTTPRFLSCDGVFEDDYVTTPME